MPRYLKIALSLTSLLILFNACSFRFHANYEKAEPFSVDGKDFIVDHFQKVLFNTQIDAFGREASGLLFIKLMGKEQYRVVFMSQVGMKFFDVELNKGEFKVHQLISYLDKKNIRRVLKNDLQLLIQKPELLSPHFFESSLNSDLLLRERSKGSFLYYNYNQNQLHTKEKAGCVFNKTIVSYEYKGTGLPSKILIDHLNFNLSWELYPIKKKLKLDE